MPTNSLGAAAAARHRLDVQAGALAAAQRQALAGVGQAHAIVHVGRRAGPVVPHLEHGLGTVTPRDEHDLAAGQPRLDTVRQPQAMPSGTLVMLVGCMSSMASSTA